MKKQECPILPEDFFKETIMQAVIKKREFEKTTDTISNLETLLIKKWDASETYFFRFLAKQLDCTLPQVRTKGRERYFMLKGPEVFVDLVVEYIALLEEPLRERLSLEWKHYRSLDECEQLAYAGRCMENRAYIREWTVSEIVRRVRYTFVLSSKSDFSKHN